MYELFHARYKLFKNVYLNRGKDALELMIQDILVEANLKYNFLEIIRNPEEYTKLNDNIIHEIALSKDPSLKKARGLVNRIKRREIYKFVAEATIPEGKKFPEV